MSEEPVEQITEVISRPLDVHVEIDGNGEVTLTVSDDSTNTDFVMILPARSACDLGEMLFQAGCTAHAAP